MPEPFRGKIINALLELKGSGYFSAVNAALFVVNPIWIRNPQQF
jgi:hypothetical protein